jgi:hypothetical protein
MLGDAELVELQALRERAYGPTAGMGSMKARTNA